MAGLGNPILGPCARATPTFQLISHRDVIAISMGRAVGIDVERIRTDFDVDEIATLFSANARDRLGKRGATQQRRSLRPGGEKKHI
jgi:hypothetical protein